MRGGQVLAGRYELRRHLTSGGMSEIWIGEHLALRMPIVVKLMKPRGDGVDEYVERFAREARAIARLRNPHVVSILDYGAEGGNPYIVMELLEGTDLLELLQRRPKLEPGEAVTLVEQVAKALHAAHAVGITHRDIKARNLFLAESGDDVIIKVLDFGIAGMSASERITAADAVLGSPFYMSPEQLRSMPLDPQVDIWALAVVAFRLVTGELPFDGETVVEVCERILRFERRRVSPAVRGAELLDSFFARAFAPAPTDRFGSVKEFSETFKRIAGPAAPITALLEVVPDAPTLEARRPEQIIERIQQRRRAKQSASDGPTQETPIDQHIPSVVPAIGEETSTEGMFPHDDAPTMVDKMSRFDVLDALPADTTTTKLAPPFIPEPPDSTPSDSGAFPRAVVSAPLSAPRSPPFSAPGHSPSMPPPVPPTFGPPPSRSWSPMSPEESGDLRRELGMRSANARLLVVLGILALATTVALYVVLR